MTDTLRLLTFPIDEVQSQGKKRRWPDHILEQFKTQRIHCHNGSLSARTKITWMTEVTLGPLSDSEESAKTKTIRSHDKAASEEKYQLIDKRI